MLSEGYTIFNGPPNKFKAHFEALGLQLGRFSNPADKLSRIAAQPSNVLNVGTTILDLHEACKNKFSEYRDMPDSIKKTMLTYTAEDGQRKLGEDESKRQVSSFKQYKLLLTRNLTQIARLPIATVALAFMGLMTGYIQASVFHDVGEPDFGPFNKVRNIQIATNLMGLALLVGND